MVDLAVWIPRGIVACAVTKRDSEYSMSHIFGLLPCSKGRPGHSCGDSKNVLQH